jgi:MoaA/NifB/PqqE/SkfB family radical SAM enzyme
VRLTSRVDLNVGYACNERCKFCYYTQTVRSHDRSKDLTTAQAKRWLEHIRRQGLDTVDLTGGEPTIRGDLFELVAHARALGFRSVAMITNGLRLASADYARACVDAGIDDFLLSIHGASAATHDQVTEAPGSFTRAVAAARHLAAYPVRVRANCVISGYNYREPVATLALFRDLGVETANFILFNPIVEADWRSAPELNVAYGEAAPYLQEALERHRDGFRRVVVRYIPLCLMRGYEAHVTNMPQIQYDPDEWDYLVRTRIREGRAVATLALGAGMLLHPSKRRALAAGWSVFLHESIKYFLQLKNKVRGAACHDCAYRLICDGLWRHYAEWRGTGELRAVPGPVLDDPAHFLRAAAPAAPRASAAPAAPRASATPAAPRASAAPAAPRAPRR